MTTHSGGSRCRDSEPWAWVALATSHGYQYRYRYLPLISRKERLRDEIKRWANRTPARCRGRCRSGTPEGSEWFLARDRGATKGWATRAGCAFSRLAKSPAETMQARQATVGTGNNKTHYRCLPFLLAPKGNRFGKLCFLSTPALNLLSKYARQYCPVLSRKGKNRSLTD